MASEFPSDFITDEDLRIVAGSSPNPFGGINPTTGERLDVNERASTEESDTQWSRRIIEAAAPEAAMALTYLARHGSNENVRLKASMHILDRTLGPMSANSQPTNGGEDDPLMKLVKAASSRS